MLAMTRSTSISAALAIPSFLAIALTGCSANLNEKANALDPNKSYVVNWLPGSAIEPAEAARLVANIHDINQFVELEQEGNIKIISMAASDRSLPSSEDRNLHAASVYCSGGTTRYTYSTSGSFSVDQGVTHDERVQILFRPSCGSYPCTKTARGSGSIVEGRHADFYWRDGSGSYNYFTTGTPWPWSDFSVSLYSGSNSINYQIIGCAISTSYPMVDWGWVDVSGG